MHRIRRVLARQTAYVGVSAIVIAGEMAGQLFVECRMFVQVKAPQETVGRVRRRAPKVKRVPQTRAHAVRFAGRFNHVENNSAVKKEKKEKAEIILQDNGFTEVKTVGRAVTAEDQPTARMQLT